MRIRRIGKIGRHKVQPVPPVTGPAKVVPEPKKKPGAKKKKKKRKPLDPDTGTIIDIEA